MAHRTKSITRKRFKLGPTVLCCWSKLSWFGPTVLCCWSKLSWFGPTVLCCWSKLSWLGPTVLCVGKCKTWSDELKLHLKPLQTLSLWVAQQGLPINPLWPISSGLIHGLNPGPWQVRLIAIICFEGIESLWTWHGHSFTIGTHSHLDRLVMCSTHGHSFVRLRY